MANFTPTKKQVSDFNNGIKYVNKVDTPSADDFNNVIESQLYSQNFAESIADTPDTSEASQVGVPSVTLINNIKNGVVYKKFKFANMKGDPGGVAPVENSQSNNTNTVPSSKLLRESSFARVYREATEIPGITYPVAIGDLVKAIIDGNMLNCYLCIGMNAATETKVTGLPVIGTTPQTYGTLTIITGSTSALRMRIEYNKEQGNDTTLMWIGSVDRRVTPYTVAWKQVIDDSSAQTISGVKTFTASPIVPTTPSGPSAAVSKSYVDGLSLSPSPYDKVIRTQTEFNALIGSDTWLGATSVALVGQFTLSTANNGGVKIPATVKQIHGFNSAKITVTNFKYDVNTGKGGLWYETAPTTQDYSIRDLEVSCTGTGETHCFANCINLSNCTGTGTGTGTIGYGFSYCNNLSNCVGKGTGTYGLGFANCINLSNCTGKGTGTTSGYGFNNCNNLSNCTGTGTGTTSGYGFFYIDYAVNCKDGGSSTAMWSGTNKNINVETCRKTPVEANKTTLNA